MRYQQLTGNQFSSVAQSCPTLRPHESQHTRPPCPSHFSFVQLCDPVDCSPSGSSVHGILQARILEWAALLQGIFMSQGSNLSLLHLLHWQSGSLPLVPHALVRIQLYVASFAGCFQLLPILNKPLILNKQWFSPQLYNKITQQVLTTTESQALSFRDSE